MSATPTQVGADTELAPALVRIPAAKFLMGSNRGQDCERPVHRVRIDEFLLAATQVTNAEYERFLRATSIQPPPYWQDANFNHPQQPVTGVSWHEAKQYCAWLTAQSGRNFRLPTEAEWECAARGGLEQKQFPWGDDPPQALPNYAARWQTGPNRSRNTLRTPSVYMTSATMFTNGAATGTTPTITRSRRTATRRARSEARCNLRAKPLAEARGVTTSK